MRLFVLASADGDPPLGHGDLRNAITVPSGWDCLADIALLRAEPAVFGSVASYATASRTSDVLAGLHALDHNIDTGATQVTSHPDKEHEAPRGSWSARHRRQPESWVLAQSTSRAVR